jgi:hypothetical protein
MEKTGYTQPETCLAGSRYYLKSNQNGGCCQFSEVTFIGYRPHPGEVIVDGGEGPRVVHRLYLFQVGNQKPGEATNTEESGQEAR